MKLVREKGDRSISDAEGQSAHGCAISRREDGLSAYRPGHGGTRTRADVLPKPRYRFFQMTRLVRLLVLKDRIFLSSASAAFTIHHMVIPSSQIMIESRVSKLQAKSSQLPAFINKVLLARSHMNSCTHHL